jgi:hypothetical protein
LRGGPAGGQVVENFSFLRFQGSCQAITAV